MKLTSFFDTFPELITKEFRNIFIDNHPVIPDGNYAFAEFYCHRVKCDCRKVMIHVVTSEPDKTWAIINYGWESEKFYKKWFANPEEKDDYYKLMSGVSLDPFPNGAIANELLKIFKTILKKDKAYAKRMEDHYWKMKNYVKNKQKNINKKAALENRLSQPDKKLGRNDPCHCGSGKKFKKCCLLRLVSSN
jgi:hypothetical protein